MKMRILLACCAALALTVGVAAALGGGAPSIAFTPGSKDFGTIDKNTTASQTFVLKNTGGSGTGALTVSLTGSSAFSKTTDGCTATALGPKKQCSVTVKYAPTTDASSDTGTLTASSKKPVAVATATLTGKSAGCAVVNTSSSQSYSALQAAVDAASPGDSLSVRGTCFGSTTISKNLTITGQNNATLDGGGSMVLDIDLGLTVTINTLTITHGHADLAGGGIHNRATLTLNNSTVTGNTASEGGGIQGDGALTLNNSTVTGNQASFGGGIEIVDQTLILNNSTVSNNTGDLQAGGINNNGGTVTLNSTSTVTGNTASGFGEGGGIYNGFASVINVNDSSSISGNHALIKGGGVYNSFASTLNLNNTSTISGNTAGTSGGGVYNDSGTVNSNGGTVSGNTPNDIAP